MVDSNFKLKIKIRIKTQNKQQNFAFFLLSVFLTRTKTQEKSLQNN